MFGFKFDCAHGWLAWAYGEKKTGGGEWKIKTRIFLNFNETLVNEKIINNTKLVCKDYWKLFWKIYIKIWKFPKTFKNF